MGDSYTVREISRIYHEPRWRDWELRAAADIPRERLFTWYRRGALTRLGKTAPGRGNPRRYSLGEALYLAYIDLLAEYSVPLRAAADLAAIWLAEGDAPRSVLPALAVAAGQPGAMYGLCYRSYTGQWLHAATSDDSILDRAALARWLSLSSSRSACLIVDLGALAGGVISSLMGGPREEAG